MWCIMEKTSRRPGLDKNDLMYLTVLAGLVFLFFWRLWIPDPADRHRFKAGDFTHIFYPARYYVARSLASGRLPLWNPYVFCGYPHLADPQAATFYPLSWLTILATRGKLTLEALQWEAVLHYFLAALFTYLFVRYVVKNREAALLAAIGFTFGGYLTGYPALQLSELEAAVWLPFVLLTSTLAVDRDSRRWAALSGMGLAMVLLAGRPQSYLGILPVTMAWFFYRAHRVEQHPRKTLVCWMVMLGFWMGIAAIQALPTWELTRLSGRSVITWDEVAEGGFRWWELAGVFIPYVVGSYSLYPGLVALVLSGMAIANRCGLFWFWAALGSLFISVGKNSSLFSVIYLAQKLLFPGYWRNLERVSLVFTFSVALLAAYGFNALRARTSRSLDSLLIRVLFITGFLWMVASLIRMVFPQDHWTSYNWLLDSLAFFSLITLALWGAVSLLRVRWRFAVLTFILVVDLFTVNMGRILEPVMGTGDPLIDLSVLEPLKSIPGLFRVEGGEVGFKDFGNVLGLENVTGMAPLEPLWHKSIMARVEEVRRLQLMNVHILVTRRRISHGAFKLLYEREGLRVYTFFDFNPRAYLVSQVFEATSDKEVIRLLNDPAFDPGKMAVVSGHFPGVPKAPLKEDEVVELLRREPTVIELWVRTHMPRLLVYASTFYPGWEAYVDGTPVTIYRANGAFRAIIVPEGPHRVSFLYRPKAFYGGAGVTILSSLLLLGIWIRPGQFLNRAMALLLRIVHSAGKSR